MWTTLKYRAAVNHKLPKIHRVTQLKFSAYDSRAETAARRAKLTLDILGINHAGPVPLPLKIKKFNWLKNPFKWKKHQELWEMRTYSRLLTFECDVDTTQMVLDFILKHLYAGTGIRVRKLTFEPLEKYYKNPYIYSGDIDLEDRLQQLRESKKKKLIITGRPVQELSLPGSVVHMNKKGETESVSLVKEPPPLPSFEEPGVLDEDIVYDDTDYRFPDPNHKQFQKIEIQQILEVLRQKTGRNLDLGGGEEGEGDSTLGSGLVYHGRCPIDPGPPPDMSALPPDIDVEGDKYHFPIARKMWEKPKPEWIPAPGEFADIDFDDEDEVGKTRVHDQQKEPKKDLGPMEKEGGIEDWADTWANPQKKHTRFVPLPVPGKPKKITEATTLKDKGQKPLEKGQKPQDKGDKPQDKGQKTTQDKGQKTTQDKGQKTDKGDKPTDKGKTPDKGDKPTDKGKTPDKGQKTPDKGQKTPDKGQKTPDKGQGEKPPEKKVKKTSR